MKNNKVKMRKSRRAAALGALLIGAGLGTQVEAENRALIIGVGEYQISEANLKGIDLDVGMMKKAATIMGYTDRQTKVLMDEQATLSQVKRTIASWLVDGVKRDDSVLLYFSGHGARIPDDNGDESDDKKDEVLVMHDFSIGRHNGEPTLKDVLVDDDLNELLKKIPSDNVLVMIDACHSGTATKSMSFNIQEYDTLRSGVDHGQEKFFQYDGMPAEQYGNKSVNTRGFMAKEESPAGNFVGISAANDNEKAIATGRGSIFTQGVLAHVESRNRSGHPLTPRSIKEATTKYIADKLGSESRSSIFHPQLNGDLTKADKAIRIARIDQGHGPTWRKVESLIGRMSSLKVLANKSTFKKGDKLKVTVDVPGTGYLNVINIDAQDNPIVIFPNKFYKNNKVSAGKVTIPQNMSFTLPAGEPYGPTLLVAFFSEKPINLFESAEGKRSDRGKMLDVFPRVSEAGLKGFGAVAEKSTLHGGKLKVNIRR